MSLEDTEAIFQQVLQHKRYETTKLLAEVRQLSYMIYALVSALPRNILSLLMSIFPLSFRTEKPPICNKTAVPPCPDEPSKKVFEQAITGALCK